MSKVRPFSFQIFFLMFVNCCPAQNFHWESKVDAVKSTGYYKIELLPEVTSQLRSGFPDLRIYDNGNLETPYLLLQDEAKKGVDRFITYQVIAKKNDGGSSSYITVRNTIGNSIDHIVLEVNNADAHRRMALSGSYDGQQWFAVKDEYTVETFNGYSQGEKKTTSLLRFDFPQTDYKFYRFDFDEWRWWWHDARHPLFIVRAGYIEPTFIPEECIDLPKPELKQEEDAKKKQSVIHISFSEPQYVDHISFMIKDKEADTQQLYYRSASLFERIENKNDSLHPFTDNLIGNTILSSLNPNEFGLENRRVKELILKINNEDDRPLLISAVNGVQIKHFLIAKLTEGKEYVLRFGSDSLQTPVYDIKYFSERISDMVKDEALRTTGRKDIYAKPDEKVKEISVEPFFKSRAFIWAAIGIVILLLAGISSRMLREMKK